MVISVTTKLKLDFECENVIAVLASNYELIARSQLTDCSFSGKNWFQNTMCLLVSLWLFLNIHC